ncbi:MAG: ATP-binding protein [Prevotella sp.]|nr:ATP-binding protein [Prevotella sp.]MBR1464360.1 ATP-binding protein [Prevotella sp.]
MKHYNPNNPFVVGKYISDSYFCDREKETEFLHKQVLNGRDVAIISPRRMGKSGLIQHFFNQPFIKNEYYVFFVDIYSTTSLAEFVYLLGKEIYEQLKPQKTIWKEKFFQIITSFRMGFKLDAMTGIPSFDIGLGDIHAPQSTLDEIFNYIEEADRPCIIAIDEFQQIGEYPEKNVEAVLRTLIQRCKKAQFIFSGSKRHMMSNMFNSPSKPFYQSVISMGLDPIPMDIYSNFAVRMFEQRGKSLDAETANAVWKMYDGYTWFVQMVMNELFSMTGKGSRCDETMVAEARDNIIHAQEDSYKDLLSQLAPRQKVVLQAIAKERKACNITSAKFINKYSLGSASSVQAAVKLLLKNDLITFEDGVYRVYDHFLSYWLVTVY